MIVEITFDDDRKLIKRTLTGTIDAKHVASLVSEIAFSAKQNENYNVLIDVINTRGGLASTSEISSMVQAFMGHNSDFKNKIALLIPDVQERRKRASQFKVGMLARGFKFEYFTDLDAALEWLSE